MCVHATLGRESILELGNTQEIKRRCCEEYTGLGPRNTFSQSSQIQILNNQLRDVKIGVCLTLVR